MQGENRIDMVGQKFGRLLVVSSAPTKHKRAFWNCLCDCGNTCVTMGKYLRQHKKQSCGCLHRENILSNIEKMRLSDHRDLPSGEAAFNLLYISYHSSATKKSLLFELSKDDFRTIIKQNCFYCGSAPIRYYRDKLPNGGYLCNGVDRRNNSVGYIVENCVPCCHKCNWMKNKYSEQEFISHCRVIVDFQNRSNPEQSKCQSTIALEPPVTLKT
jgi:hypothetical protein